MSVYTDLRGTGVAIITPFTAKGAVDYKALTRIVNHLVKGGVEYIVALGTTGETATLDKQEKSAIVSHIRDAAGKRVKLVLGIGGNNTLEIAHQLENTDMKGYSAVLSVSPYYNKPSQRGIIAHYKTLAKASPLPVILYNVPGRTASNLTAETTLELAEEKNIMGIKEASGNLEQVMKIIKHRPTNFLVISGDDNLTLPILGCGGDGVISVVANAFPKIFSEMTRQGLKGNMKEAQRLHYKLTDITEQLFADGNPGGVKAVMEMLDICGETLRLPLVPVNDAVRKKLKSLIKEL